MAIEPIPTEPRSIVRLIAEGTVDANLGALLWLLVEARIPVIVAAGPQRTGKTTMLQALLAFLPPETDVHPLAGYAEDFRWLPEAAALGWRPHGFGGIAGREPGGAGARRPAPAVGIADPTRTYLLVHEFSDHLPIYTWGEQARVAVRALSLGYGLGGTVHADSLAEVFAELGGSEVGLTDDELSRIGVVLIVRVVRAPGSAGVVRRVVAAHYVRPVARDVAGHVQRLGPAVLATWDPITDRFEDFAWGLFPELAEAIGGRFDLPAGGLDAERTARAEYLSALARGGVTGGDEVRAAITHYRHRTGRGPTSG